MLGELDCFETGVGSQVDCSEARIAAEVCSETRIAAEVNCSEIGVAAQVCTETGVGAHVRKKDRSLEGEPVYKVGFCKMGFEAETLDWHFHMMGWLDWHFHKMGWMDWHIH